MRVIMLILVTVGSCCGSSQCSDPRNAGARFSISSKKNQTGHWLAQVRLEHGEMTRGEVETGRWELAVDQSVAACGDTEAVSVIVTVAAPPPRAGPGYELFPGVGFYKFHVTTATWDEARKTCVKEGAHLAIVNSDAEAKVLGLLYSRNPQAIGWAYIGFHDQIVEGDYITVFGEPLSKTGYLKWKTNEPNNVGGNEDCGTITRDAMFNDKACDTKLNFICEQELY